MRNYDVDNFSERLSDLDLSIIDLLDDRKNRPLWYNTIICNLANDRDILQRNYRRTGSSNKAIYARI